MSKEQTTQTQGQPAQAQQSASFPFSAPSFEAPSFEEVRKHLLAFNEQAAQLQQRAAEQVRTTIDESARVMKEAVAYGLRLSDDWRKLSVEATEKMSSAFTPKR